jgi:hypothetical protein
MASQFFGKNTLIHYNMARGSCNWEGNIQDEKAFSILNIEQFIGIILTLLVVIYNRKRLGNAKTFGFCIRDSNCYSHLLVDDTRLSRLGYCARITN